MQVCFVSFEYPPKIFGGLGIYAENLVKGLRNNGVNVLVIASGNGTNEPNTCRISTPDIEYWQRYFFIKRAIRMISDLNKYEKFDLVHFNGPYPIIKRLKVPTVCTFHSVHFALTKVSLHNLKLANSPDIIKNLVVRNTIGSLFDISMARISDKIICPSPSLVREIKSYCFAKEQKIHMIPNGFDTGTFDEINFSDNSLLNRYNIKNGNYFLYMGRLTSLKGIEFLIKAFLNMKKKYTDLKLVIAGSGYLAYQLRKMACDEKDIIFTGFIRSQKVKKLLYKNCLAVVIPSLHETLPMVALEAMICKKPVIASDIGGMRLMIKHGKNGFIIKSKDIKSLEKSLQILYENPNLRRSMGSFGRMLVEKEFTVDKMVSNTLDVYQSLY
jgi:glycosyltransferase involved in cell wall biosynthesis